MARCRRCRRTGRSASHRTGPSGEVPTAPSQSCCRWRPSQWLPRPQPGEQHCTQCACVEAAGGDSRLNHLWSLISCAPFLRQPYLSTTFLETAPNEAQHRATDRPSQGNVLLEELPHQILQCPITPNVVREPQLALDDVLEDRHLIAIVVRKRRVPACVYTRVTHATSRAVHPPNRRTRTASRRSRYR